MFRNVAELPPAPPRLSPSKRALFAGVAVVLVLAMLETSVRAYHFVRNVGTDHEEDPRGYLIEDAEAGYALRPGFSGGGVRINSLGFRGPEVAAKAPGSLRIVALGDSATFGPREEECAYPYLLPDLFPQPVESLNAGVEGYRTDRALVHLRRDVLPLQPDVVTVFLGWNDLYQTNPNDEADQLSLRANPLAALFLLSDAAQTFRRVYFLDIQSHRGQTAGTTSGVPLDYQPVGYADRLRQIVRAARTSGARVSVLTWPTILDDSMTAEAIARVQYPPYTTRLIDVKVLYARYQNTLRHVAADEQAAVIDVAAAFNSQFDKATLFKDTAHFSCQGHAIVARTVADALFR
jgi:lysophospholipase L1-like esterase